MHTYIHTYIHSRIIFTYIHQRYIHTYMHTYLHTYIHTYIQLIYLYILTLIYACLFCRSVTYMGGDVFKSKYHNLFLGVLNSLIMSFVPVFIVLGNSALSSVSIPTSLVVISDGTFYGCRLETVTIPT